MAAERSPKEAMIALIEDLPDDSSWEEVLRELAFHRMIERGLADVATGQLLCDGDLAERMRRWRR